MNTTNPILVTGAAGGRQGSTGRHIARMLLQQGADVRAFVHRLDERSDALRTLGAEVVPGDLLDLESVRRAMRGIRRACFVYPVQEGLVDATAVFATAARENGVEMLVNISQFLVKPDLPTPRQRQHWLSENIFTWAGVGAVHLDATVFFENLWALSHGSVLKTGVLPLPWGPETTVIPLVAGEDVARVAAGVLSGSTRANGTILPLVGDVLTVKGMADAFSAVLDKPVVYRELTEDQWLQAVAGANLNQHGLEHLTKLWRFLRTREKKDQENYAVTDSIDKIGGAKPKRLGDFLREQVGVFKTAQPVSA